MGSSQSDLNVNGQKCFLLTIWVLWVVKGTIKFKSGSLSCRNYAFSPFWMVKQNEKHEKKYTCRTVRGVIQFNMFLIKSQHLMWISILHEERHQEIFQCYHTLVKLLPTSDQWSISLLKNVHYLSPLATFTMLFLPSIFSFSVTTSQIPSHSYISVFLFHFHLLYCRNHFLFRCYYLEWASPYQQLFHLLSNIKNIIQSLPWIACLGLLSLLRLNYSLNYSLTV